MPEHDDDDARRDPQAPPGRLDSDPSDRREMDGTQSSVGYGRPPHHSKFAKGKSGNPKGRPKGAKSFATLFDEELNTKIPINENGKRRTISKREAVAKQLVNKAASGDPKAIPILLNEARSQEKAGGSATTAPLRAEDQQVMASVLERLRRNLSQNPDQNAPLPPDPSAPPEIKGQ